MWKLPENLFYLPTDRARICGFPNDPGRDFKKILDGTKEMTSYTNVPRKLLIISLVKKTAVASSHTERIQTRWRKKKKKGDNFTKITLICIICARTLRTVVGMYFW
jgi:hypothetical protein